MVQKKTVLTLRIEAAIAHYNERVPAEEKLTKGQLALLVIHNNDNPNMEVQKARKQQMLSRWLKGNTSGLTPQVVFDICKTTKVSLDFIFGIKK